MVLPPRLQAAAAACLALVRNREAQAQLAAVAARQRTAAARRRRFAVVVFLAGLAALQAADASLPLRQANLLRNADSGSISNILQWPTAQFKSRLRVSPRLFRVIVEGVSGYVQPSQPRNPAFRRSREFKVGVALYFLAHGCDFIVLADVAGCGVQTVRTYVLEVVRAMVLGPLRRRYMRKPTPEERALSMQQFQMRRGLPNVPFVGDGTHIPWRPDCALTAEDYHNYKGWYSILCMAFVNSFYCFVDAEVGWPGRTGDAAILHNSTVLNRMNRERDEWLGPDGVCLVDGGMGGVHDWMMPPFGGHNMTIEELYFDYAHSSTRMFCEQAFGMLKNRSRFLLTESLLSHRVHCLCVMATMVLHNMCMLHRDDTVQYNNTDADIIAAMQKYKQNLCPSCAKANRFTCCHPFRKLAGKPNGTMVEKRAALSAQYYAQTQRERGAA